MRNLLQLIFIFLAVQLNFKAFSQSNSTYVNGTVQFTIASPSGGTITNINGYTIHTFTSSGTLTVPAGFTSNATTLIVAGGGGGGYRHAGGGGAGGLIYNTGYTLTSTKDVVVGAGGRGSIGYASDQTSLNGSSSSFDGSVAVGGGAGADNNIPGKNGGSGGGGSNTTDGGTGVSGQGKKGGKQGFTQYQPFGAGGGGYSFAGADTNPTEGSAGGDGITLDISGANASYAGGGGGGNGNNSTTYQGGLGGGGKGGNDPEMQGTDGTANTGGGGGGGGAISGDSGNGGSGGSGVVIIKYLSGTGTWSSDNTAVATVNPSTGIVTGVSAGTANIIYSIANGNNQSNYNQSLTVSQYPLAVTLLYFNATSNNCAANLVWKTSSEINNKYYEVQSSSDGAIFNSAAKVTATNNATGSNYQYSLSSLKTGLTYYRLKIVSTNGSFTYSPIITFTKKSDCGTESNLMVSPNPARDFVTVSGLIQGNHLSLINTSGLHLTTVEEIGTTQIVDLSLYAKGIYIIREEAVDGSVRTVKVVKQ